MRQVVEIIKKPIFPCALHDVSRLPACVGLSGKEFADVINADPAAVSRNQLL